MKLVGRGIGREVRVTQLIEITEQNDDLCIFTQAKRHFARGGSFFSATAVILIKT